MKPPAWVRPLNGFGWGYQAGPAKIAFSMKLNEKGEWVETGEATMPNTPARRFLEMTVRKEK